jgi:ribonucleoside-diphosphate reductase alpha chain
MTRFAAPIAEQIWDMKYRLKSAEGKRSTKRWRIRGAVSRRDLASVEADPRHMGGPFYEALEDFRYLPAGRIVAGAGTGRR